MKNRGIKQMAQKPEKKSDLNTFSTYLQGVTFHSNLAFGNIMHILDQLFNTTIKPKIVPKLYHYL